MIGFWHVMTALAGILVLAGLISILLGQLAIRRYFKQECRLPFPDRVPMVSILKPVEGVDRMTYEAFASFCRMDYPGEMELLIGTIRADDPIVSVVDKLRAEFPGIKIRLVLAELKGANRKTSIMEALWRDASGEFLFFSDADAVVSRDHLRLLVPQVAAPGVGCLTCLPRGIAAGSAGGRMIALHYAFNNLPQWMLARQTTGIHWASGLTMAVPRGVLEQLGGFKNFLNHLADDYELGNRVSRLGLHVVVPPMLVDCAMASESFTSAFTRLLRWKRTIRRAHGIQSLGGIITYPVFWALVLALLQPFAWWSWSVLGLVVVIRWWLATGVATLVKIPDWPRIWWLLPIVDVVEAIACLGAYFGNAIFWAGRHYVLHSDGTLELANMETLLKKAEPVAAAEN